MMGNGRSSPGGVFPLELGGSLEALADAMGRWRVALPVSQLQGAVAEGVSRPCPSPCAPGRVGMSPAQALQDSCTCPTTCLRWDQQQPTATAAQCSWCKNNTSGGINKLFLCGRGGHAELAQGRAWRCPRGLTQTC